MESLNQTSRACWASLNFWRPGLFVKPEIVYLYQSIKTIQKVTASCILFVFNLIYHKILARVVSVPVGRRSGVRLATTLVATINNIIFFFIFAKLSSSKQLQLQLNWDSFIITLDPPDHTRPGIVLRCSSRPARELKFDTVTHLTNLIKLT